MMSFREFHQELHERDLATEDLFFLIKQNQSEKLYTLLKEFKVKPDINAKNKEGITPLMLAAQKSNAPIVSLLLNSKADMTLRDEFQRTALMHAAHHGNIDAGKILIDNAPPEVIHAEDKNGTTALIFAAEQGDRLSVERLINKKADIHKRNTFNLNALISASINGHVSTMKLLIDEKADVNVKSHQGRTALMYATLNGIEPLQLLLDKKPALTSLNYQELREGKTALMLARDIQTSKALIAAKATLDLQDIAGYTALMLAADYGRNDVLKGLLDAKANVYLKNLDSKTALDFAFSPQAKQLIRDATPSWFSFLLSPNPTPSEEKEEKQLSLSS